MNTTENNKLIAEFMSFKEVNKCVRNAETGKYYDYHANQDFSCIKEDEIQIEGENGFGLVEQDFLFAEDLKFHSDWNWLMPVMQEIGNRTGYELCMHFGYSYWNNSGNEATDSEYGGYENIKNIHHAVVEFIKWYNEQNPKP